MLGNQGSKKIILEEDPMELMNEIKTFLQSTGGKVKEKKDRLELNLTVAERKTFLSKQKLSYSARLRLDEKKKTVRFFEMLKESSSGMSSPGVTVSTQKFKVGKGGQQESVFQQQADFFGKSYDYTFDFKTIRSKIEEMAKANGYDFQYQVTPKGI